jgi:hypothetical protein
MADPIPVSPTRVVAFTKFFRTYMNLWTVVVASLPIPVTQLHWIPTYHSQAGFLSLYTSLFCFLLLALIFYNRHIIARSWFKGFLSGKQEFRSKSGVVVVLIICSAVCVLAYHSTLEASIETIHSIYGYSTKAILEDTDPTRIPDEGLLSVWYVGIFVTAEAAFILMALREYIQDLLGITDNELIRK